MSIHTVPKDLRNLRACLLCSLVKTIEQFEFDGCDNCEDYLHMKGNRDIVYDCTSANFDGLYDNVVGPNNFVNIIVHLIITSQPWLITMISPEDSWVAKWQRVERFAKGCYAVSVTGQLPPGVVRDLRSRGIEYRHRDTSQKS